MWCVKILRSYANAQTGTEVVNVIGKIFHVDIRVDTNACALTVDESLKILSRYCTAITSTEGEAVASGEMLTARMKR